LGFLNVIGFFLFFFIWTFSCLNMFFLNVRDMEAYQAHMRSDRLNNHVWWTISMVCEGILCTSEM
jgi:hypothetical protein